MTQVKSPRGATHFSAGLSEGLYVGRLLTRGAPAPRSRALGLWPARRRGTLASQPRAALRSQHLGQSSTCLRSGGQPPVRAAGAQMRLLQKLVLLLSAAATSRSNSFCNNRIWASAARAGGCPPLRKHLLDCPKCCDRRAARGCKASVPRRLAGQGPKARDRGAGAPRDMRRPTS